MENKEYGFVETEKHEEFTPPVGTYELFSHRTGGLCYLLALLLPQIIGAGILAALAPIIKVNSDPYLFLAFFITQGIMALSLAIAVEFKIKRASVRMHFNKAVKKTDYLIMIPLALCLVLGLNFIPAIFLSLMEKVGYVMQEIPFPDTTSAIGFVSGFICICVMPAIVEECIFRGVILRSFSQKNIWKGILFSSALFSLMHGSAQQTMYQFVVGVILAIVAIKTNSILPSILLHMLNNTISLLITFIPLDVQTAYLGYAMIPCFFGVCGIVAYFLNRKTPKLDEFEEEIKSQGSIVLKDQKGNPYGMSRDISSTYFAVKKAKKYQGYIFYGSAIAFGIFVWITMVMMGF